MGEFPGLLAQVALQVADRNRAFPICATASDLARLGTDPSRDAGEWVAEGEDGERFLDATLCQVVEVAGDRDRSRAFVGACRTPLGEDRPHVAPIPGLEHAAGGVQRYRNLRVIVDVGEITHRHLPCGRSRRPRWRPPCSHRPCTGTPFSMASSKASSSTIPVALTNAPRMAVLTTGWAAFPSP